MLPGTSKPNQLFITFI